VADISLARFRRPLLAALGLVSLAYLYLGTRPQAPSLLQGVSDVVIHGGAYLLLGLVAGATALAMSLPRPGLIGFVYTVGHGALLELLQLFTPPRQAEVKDLLVDAIAALLAAVVFSWRRR
jgi:VanZ family protein